MPQFLCHVLNPKRVDAEDPQLSCWLPTLCPPLPSSHQNQILFMAANVPCLPCSRRGARVPSDTVWLISGQSQVVLPGPCMLPFLLSEPWAWWMELWWPTWSLTMTVTPKDGRGETHVESVFDGTEGPPRHTQPLTSPLL